MAGTTNGKCGAHVYVSNKGVLRSASDAPEVNPRIPLHAQARGSPLVLKLRGDVTRSPNQGYQWPYSKGLMSSEIFETKPSL